MSLETKRYMFGGYILDTGERTLICDGKVVAVPPKVLELLFVLVENHGHVVKKSVLMDKLWADTFVEESNLTFSIRKLRKILSDDAHEPEFIETIPKRGYQFIAPVTVKTVSSDGIDPIQADRRNDPVALVQRMSVPLIAVVILLVGALSAIYIYDPWGKHSFGVDWTAARSVQLTDQPGIEYFPSISPDGKDIVYAAKESDSFDIFIQRVGTRRRVNLTPNTKDDDTQPTFSPNGNLIAFRSEREPKGIYTIEISGDNLRRVSDEGFHPSWSPDGKRIVVSSWERDQPTIRAQAGMYMTIVDVQTGEKRELIKAEATFPSWSPNGHRIAYWFHTGTFGRREIATVPAGGGEPVIVAKDFAVSNWNPVWSPDGKFLYFVSSRSGNMNFWRVAIDEGSGTILSEPEPVATPSTYSRHITFSRNGKLMAYVQTNNNSNIQGVNFDDHAGRTIGEPFWITEGDREISRAELSPDGTRFVMRLIRSTQEDIITVSRDGREWRDVTNDEPFERYVRWSPDGKRLAFYSDRNSGGQVWICNADGTGLRQLTFNPAGPTSTAFPVWSPDGATLSVQFANRTMLLDPNRSQDQQEARILPNQPGDRMVVWDWSPDGTKLAAVVRTDQERHVGYYSLDTQTYERIVEDSGAIPSWLADSRRFVYSTGSKIYIADIYTKAVRELFSNPLVNIHSPFVSRDGKLLYYAAATSESDIWMLDLTDSPP
jgi:Tol biopolymer transport system component/DNA-binding winged helix-turn-helix (wHTH) protein